MILNDLFSIKDDIDVDEGEIMISIGSKAPEWKATAYHNGEFVTLSSEDYKGKWVLIYWW